ncbi:MAG: hypothetical protein EB020_05040 [Proteobacteria bacterium]|nr:hypothetical protein [Pseudomonadota bacterium]
MLDAIHGELDFRAAANTDMWGGRADAPIAWVETPDVAAGGKWSFETQVRIDQRDEGYVVSGITFYNNQDGGLPDFTFGINNWDGGFVHVQQLDGGRKHFGDLRGPNTPTNSDGSTSAFLKVEVVEQGAQDAYQFFYKLNAADPANGPSATALAQNEVANLDFTYTVQDQPAAGQVAASTAGQFTVAITGVDGGSGATITVTENALQQLLSQDPNFIYADQDDVTLEVQKSALGKKLDLSLKDLQKLNIDKAFLVGDVAGSAASNLSVDLGATGSPVNQDALPQFGASDSEMNLTLNITSNQINELSSISNASTTLANAGFDHINVSVDSNAIDGILGPTETLLKLDNLDSDALDVRLDIDPATGSARIGNLGSEYVAASGMTFAETPDEGSSDQRRYFSETGRYVSFGFLAYYDSVGGSSLLGQPVTPEVVEGDNLAQYFEKGKLVLDRASGVVRVSPLGEAFLKLSVPVAPSAEPAP